MTLRDFIGPTFEFAQRYMFNSTVGVRCNDNDGSTLQRQSHPVDFARI